MSKEIWKDIKGYEGLYQVSNYGRIKSFIKDEKILSFCDNGNGYLYITLRKNGIRKNYYIHRLVATYFLENPFNKNVVNHKDFNIKNNNADNLEWVTQYENVIYSISNMKKRKSITHSNTGEKYISYRASKKLYRVIIDKKEYGSFKNLQEAINKRDEILKAVITQ